MSCALFAFMGASARPPQPLPSHPIPAACRVVMIEIVRALLTPTFLREVFRPQKQVYTVAALRAVFERLAHSSIMRLNSASMDKLFDLMLMGVKYQVICAATHSSLPFDVTSQHLETLRDLLHVRGAVHADAYVAKSADATPAPPAVDEGSKTDDVSAQAPLPGVEALTAAAAAAAVGTDDGTIADLIDAVGRTMRAVYGSLPPSEMASLYGALLSFFQDQRTRVSLLLAEGVQLPNGALLVPPTTVQAPESDAPVGRGIPLVAGGKPPAPSSRSAPAPPLSYGSICYYGPDGNPIGALATMPPPVGNRAPSLPLAAKGGNIYSASAYKKRLNTTDDASNPAADSATPAAVTPPVAQSAPPEPTQPLASFAQHGLAGVNLLASLVGVGAGGGSSREAPIAMDFGDFDANMNWGAQSSAGTASSLVVKAAALEAAPTIARFNGSAASQLARSMADIDSQAHAPAGADDDLLAMMDAHS